MTTMPAITMRIRLDEHRLRLWVRLLGDEADRRLCQRGVGAPVVAEQDHTAVVAEEAKLLGGDIDVGLERLVVVDARELRLRGDVVAELHRDVAHRTVEGAPIR
jgi:hypothetical protein